MTTNQPSRHRLRALAVAALGVAALVTAPGLADASGGRRVTNTAAIVDRQAGAPAHKVAWAVQKLYGGGTARNTASAKTRCDGCRATAIALQIVLVSQLRSPLALGNGALAVNTTCSTSAADAYAYQFVVASDGKVTLTGAGWGQLQALVGQLVALARSGGPPAVIAPQVEAIAASVVAVLQAQIWVTPVRRTGGSALTQGLATAPMRQAGFEVQVRRQIATG